MPLNNFGIASRGLYRCGQPDREGINSLASIGVKTILKLNSEVPEEYEWCKLVGITLTNNQIPTLTNTAEVVKALVARLNNLMQIAGPVCVHCEHGRDRTGLIIGAYRLIYDKAPFTLVQAERAAYGVTGLFTFFDREITSVLAQISDGLKQSNP
jgi:protein tyrosine/serine phosphatase